jgi:hypothetical protein
MRVFGMGFSFPTERPWMGGDGRGRLYLILYELSYVGAMGKGGDLGFWRF